MRVLPVLVLVLAIGPPVRTYEGLSDALRDGIVDEASGRLSPEAVQYVVEQCRLTDVPEWHKALNYGREVTGGRVSRNRHYCILTKQGAYEGRELKAGAVCLINADSCRLWCLRARGIVTAADVSDSGTVAFSDARSALVDAPFDIGIIDAQGETLFARHWEDRVARRPYPHADSREFDAYGFSPGGYFFFATINRAGGDTTGLVYSNTFLYCYDLRAGVEHVEKLGAFWPSCMEASRDGLDIRGHTAEYVQRRGCGDFWITGLVISDPFDTSKTEQRVLAPLKGPEEEIYRITWVPWKVERIPLQKR